MRAVQRLREKLLKENEDVGNSGSGSAEVGCKRRAECGEYRCVTSR